VFFSRFLARAHPTVIPVNIVCIQRIFQAKSGKTEEKADICTLIILPVLRTAIRSTGARIFCAQSAFFCCAS